MSEPYDAEQLAEMVEFGMRDIELTHPSDWLSVQDRDRPYEGQPHTHNGWRGTEEVKGITMRDVFDCFIIALFESTGYGEAERPRGSVYELDLKDLDPVAIGQNLVVEVEKRMGIYPNLPDEGMNDEEER